MLSLAANSVHAQVISLLFEARAADAKVGEEFEALNGPFEIRWSATSQPQDRFDPLRDLEYGNGFVVYKLRNDIPLKQQVEIQCS